MNDWPHETYCLLEWESTCAEVLGQVLPLNMLEFDRESSVMSVGHRVAEDAPPLVRKNGDPVRLVAMDFFAPELGRNKAH